MIKKIISLFIIFAIFLSTTGVFAADVLFEYKSTTPLSKGVFLDKYRLFMSDGSFNEVSVVRGDLTNPDLKIDVLYDSRGVSYLNTVPNIAEQNNTIAAINADYFGWGEDKTKRGFSIGAAYKNSEVLTTPSLQQGMNAMGIDYSGNFIFDIFEFNINIIAPNGSSHPIKAINKYDDLTGIMLYNHHWDSQSLGSYGNLYEVVIKDGIVEQILFESPAVPLEENTIVLAALADHNTFLLDNFQLGDPIDFEINANPSPENIKMAVGGGAMLVQNGKIPEKYSHIVNGTNPLSACGVNKAGDTFYMIVVDGRQANSRGMTQKELSSFMVDIGIYNGICLDGGGSTTMAVQMPNSYKKQQVVNSVSGSSLRPISNVLGLSVTTNGDKIPRHIEIIDDGKNIWANTKTQLSVNVTDSHYSPIYVPNEEVVWEISGVEGSIIDGLLVAKSTGYVTIKAAYNGLLATKTLKVLERPYSIIKPASEINLNINEAKDIWLFARDEEGYIAPFKLSEAVLSINKDIVSIEGTALVGKARGSGLLSITFGDAIAYMVVHVDGDSEDVELPSDILGKDSANLTGQAPESADRNTRIAVFGQIRPANTLFNNLIMKKVANTINKSDADITGFVSSYTDQSFLSQLKMRTLTCDNYTSFTDDNNTFITINSKGGGIYTGGSDQWNKLINQLKAVNTKNLFVFIPTHINFNSGLESQLLKDVLSEVGQRGVTVYAFYNNWATASTPYDGVRYISTPGFSDDITLTNVAGRLFKLRYILIDIDKSGNVTYRFMQLY